LNRIAQTREPRDSRLQRLFAGNLRNRHPKSKLSVLSPDLNDPLAPGGGSAQQRDLMPTLFRKSPEPHTVLELFESDQWWKVRTTFDDPSLQANDGSQRISYRIIERDLPSPPPLKRHHTSELDRTRAHFGHRQGKKNLFGRLRRGARRETKSQEEDSV